MTLPSRCVGIARADETRADAPARSAPTCSNQKANYSSPSHRAAVGSPALDDTFETPVEPGPIPCKSAVAETPAEPRLSTRRTTRPAPTDAAVRASCRSLSSPSPCPAWHSPSIAKSLDGQVAAFRYRPLDRPVPLCADRHVDDAVREGGRSVGRGSNRLRGRRRRWCVGSRGTDRRGCLGRTAWTCRNRWNPLKICTHSRRVEHARLATTSSPTTRSMSSAVTSHAGRPSATSVSPHHEDRRGTRRRITVTARPTRFRPGPPRRGRGHHRRSA